jgi:glutamate transport system substrate-binding protein
MTSTLLRRTAPAAAAAALVTVALTGCGGSSGTPQPPGAAPGSGGGGGSSYDSIITGGPKADSAAISASAWAQAVQKQGYLRRGGTDTGPLFSLKDPVTGKVTGFDAGLSQMLAHYITGKTDVQNLEKLTITTVDTRETLLQNHSVDTVIATYTITPARAQKVDFAGPYYESGDAIMVKADNSSIKTVDDLHGKKVATESNSTAALALKQKVPDAQVTLFQTDPECQAAVQQGRVDAYVLDQGILISDASTNKQVKVVGQPFTQEPYGIGLPKDEPDAKKFVNDFLQKIYADGSWAKLWKATIGTIVNGNPPTPPTIGSAPGS